MSFIDNLNILRERFPAVWKKFDIPDHLPADSPIKAERAQNGAPTLFKAENGRTIYLHSKYDPQKEAKTFIGQYEDAQGFEQVLFFGMGLGYHIREFARKFPEKKMFIYEPSKEVFFSYLYHCDLNDFPIDQIIELDVERDEADRKAFARRLVGRFMGQNLLTVILPSYQRAFTPSCEGFTRHILEELRGEKVTLGVNVRFQKRWVENSVYNLEETLKTPNLFADVDRSHFRGKPALIVAAGPSLAEEIEQIRKIKQEGLAYIFAAGSSLSILLNNNILPDALCTYDPNPWNHLVIDGMVEKGITSVPVIFGTTVGHETLEIYSGPKLHMPTNQDWLGRFLLKGAKGKELDYVFDSPTISVITFQFLLKLGCNPIVLVGQNLALKDGRRYPKGISYYDEMETINNTGVFVEDVEGNQIETIESYNQMRKALEDFIAACPSTLQVINTTRGGAKIARTKFQYLEDLIDERLTRKAVDEDWFPTRYDFAYDQDHLRKRINLLNRELREFPKKLAELERVLEKMWQALNSRGKEAALLYPLFSQFDKAFNSMMKNRAHTILIEPMNRVEFDNLIKRIKAAGGESDQIKKANLVLTRTASYVNNCKKDLEAIKQVWDEKMAAVMESLDQSAGDFK